MKSLQIIAQSNEARSTKVESRIWKGDPTVATWSINGNSMPNQTLEKIEFEKEGGNFFTNIFADYRPKLKVKFHHPVKFGGFEMQAENFSKFCIFLDKYKKKCIHQTGQGYPKIKKSFRIGWKTTRKSFDLRLYYYLG